MKFGTGSTTELTQKREGQSTKMPYVRPNIYVTGFGKIGLNTANNFFQYPRVKPYGLIFLENIFMAEMDRHQLALAYDAVVSFGVL